MTEFVSMRKYCIEETMIPARPARYTFHVPLDVAAEVISNLHLSPEYNVLALAAPEIAGRALPGQFVMVKAGGQLEPLLRRPFSVFEVLKDNGTVIGLSLLSKRIGPSTRLIFDARPGDRIQCLGPLGRPFAPVAAPDEAWLVAGGVGLAPFATLAEALRARNIRTKLYYGARRAAELFYLDAFEKLGVELVLATEDGSRGEPSPMGGSREWVTDRGRVTVPLERDLTTAPGGARIMLYACGPEPMLAAVARLAATHGCPSQVSVERVMGCGVGGCYSCVIPVNTSEGKSHFVRACLAGPVFRGSEIAW
jgi:dihydroorotate dehydrogenase electron transfer subunit